MTIGLILVVIGYAIYIEGVIHILDRSYWRLLIALIFILVGLAIMIWSVW